MLKHNLQEPEESNTAPRPRLPRNVVLLGWASLGNDIASEMIFPLLPRYVAQVLGAGAITLGVMEGLADFAAALLKLWSGWWSDRAGDRKGFVVAGYSIAALGRPLLALATAPWQAVAIRVGDRIGKGLRTAPRDAVIAESTPEAQRGAAFGYHRAMDHLGAAIGPLLAMLCLWLFPERLRLIVGLSLVPGLFVVALVVFGLAPQPPKIAAGKRFSLRLTGFDGRFRRLLGASALFALANSSDLFLLAWASARGLSEPLVPLLWLALSLVKSGGTLVAGRAVPKFGARRLMLLGWALYAVVYGLIGLANSAWQVVALVLVYGLFDALTEPAEKTLVARLAGDQAGQGFGWFHFSVGLAALPGNALFGWVYEAASPTAAFSMAAGFAALAAVVLATIRE
ncbi:MAG: MFS transporter [Pirellulales bacterium]